MLQRRVFGDVFQLESIVAGVVLLLVCAGLAWALLRRRARTGAQPSQRAEHNRLEVFYASALAAFAVFLVVWTAAANHREHHVEKPVTVHIKVVGFQWCWEFDHPRTDGTIHTERTNCAPGHLPTLLVPTGRTVRLELTSHDVIHSLWVPSLRYKMDAFPDHVNTFTLRIDKEGRWVGRCAEFCGERHHLMDFWLKAVSPKEYDHWLAGNGPAAGAAA